jgi:hypothetical protein
VIAGVMTDTDGHSAYPRARLTFIPIAGCLILTSSLATLLHASKASGKRGDLVHVTLHAIRCDSRVLAYAGLIPLDSVSDQMP